MLMLNQLMIEHDVCPRLVPVTGARFGWKLAADAQNVLQTSYRIDITGDDGSVFSTGVVESSENVDVVLPFTLQSGARYFADVTATDNRGQSDTKRIQFRTVLQPKDWHAKWIKAADVVISAAPYIRKKFKTSGKVTHAELYACGLGCAEYLVNGKKVTWDYIDPPATDYEREVLYRAYDVTPFIEENNCICALLGEGFYAQSRVWGPGNYIYGDVCLCAELRLTYADGRTEIVATDKTWKYKYSPITNNNIYAGEVYDCRFETPDCALFSGSEDGWRPCVLDTKAKQRGVLAPCTMPPVREIRKLPALSVHPVSGANDGAWVLDMGVNFAGTVEYHLPRSPRGHIYVFRYAEALNESGALDYRSAGTFATQVLQQDTYICRGDEEGEVYRPRLTYHGFRYIEISGFYSWRNYGAMPATDIAVGIALSTDFNQMGWFECDNTDLMRLQKVMLNSFRSNYHGYPEDCPAREKCGWLGDAQIVANYAMFNYDMRSSYEKYLDDIRRTCEAYGEWRMVSPGKRGCNAATPLWGCAQVIIPYYMYHYYGDRDAVIKNWDLMQAWVKHELKDKSKDYIIEEGLGDWCPPCGHSSPLRIPVPQSSTMTFYEIAAKMAELCRDFGFAGAEKYDALADRIKRSIIKHFYNKKKHTYGTWGANGVALKLGLYPDGDREALLASQLEQMRADDYAMTTGIYANKYLVPALFDENLGDEAMKFLFNHDHTSFYTMLEDGATSLWEILSMHTVEKNRDTGVGSYNHPMHAGFAYIYYAYIAGMQPTAPGFKSFTLKPIALEGVNSVNCTFECPHGAIRIKYDREGEAVSYRVEVPVNTTCVFTPMGTDEKIELGSGVYTFTR